MACILPCEHSLHSEPGRAFIILGDTQFTPVFLNCSLISRLISAAFIASTSPLTASTRKATMSMRRGRGGDIISRF